MKYTDGYYGKREDEAKARVRELKNQGVKAQVVAYTTPCIRGKSYKVVAEGGCEC